MYTFDHVRITPDKQIGRHSQSGYELDYIITGKGIRTLGSVSEPFREGEGFAMNVLRKNAWCSS